MAVFPRSASIPFIAIALTCLVAASVTPALAISTPALATSGGVSPNQPGLGGGDGEPDGTPDPGTADKPSSNDKGGGVHTGRKSEPSGNRNPGSGAGKKRKKPRKKRKHRRGDYNSPVLTSFRVTPNPFFALAHGTRVYFRIADRSSSRVRVRLVVIRTRTNEVIRRFDLGEVRTGKMQTYTLPDDGFRQGFYRLRISARDRAGHRLRRRAGASSVERLSFYNHRFPIAGPHTYGGPGSEFGADRGDHIHQGQDILAPQGTPLVAPRGGSVKWISFQEEGAGLYVVIKARGEDRDYVFMHLQQGSVDLEEGQQVATGTRVGAVGQTGNSKGPHLHFEVWEGGGWYTGGHPIDPLPLLKAWDQWS